MNAMQAMLSRLRATKKQPDKVPASKPSLASVLAKHRATKAETKAIGQWREPSESLFKVQLITGLDLSDFLKVARFNFPRINARILSMSRSIIQVEGKAEARWLAWFAESKGYRVLTNL